MKNSIVVELPGVDSITGKKKRMIHDFLIIKRNLEMRHGRIIEFTEEDGSQIQAANEFQRQLFLPKQINEETDGRWVDPLTGFDVPEGTPDAIADLQYWQTIPVTAHPAIAPLPQNVKDALANITIADLMYWLLEQSILSGNAQNKY